MIAHIDQSGFVVLIAFKELNGVRNKTVSIENGVVITVTQFFAAALTQMVGATARLESVIGFWGSVYSIRDRDFPWRAG